MNTILWGGSCSPVGSQLDWVGALDLLLPLNVPAEYTNLAEVFSKQRATTLPPYLSYDCTINLLPDTVPPAGSLYSLSAPENKALRAYIEEALANGFIRPSTSPTSDTKPDALSRRFDCSDRGDPPEAIIPSARILEPLTWGIKVVVQGAQKWELDPQEGPWDRQGMREWALRCSNEGTRPTSPITLESTTPWNSLKPKSCGRRWRRM